MFQIRYIDGIFSNDFGIKKTCIEISCLSTWMYFCFENYVLKGERNNIVIYYIVEMYETLFVHVKECPYSFI